MALKKSQGSIGESMVMAEAIKRGYKVALPFGEDWLYDLIVLRKGKLEKVQCKYTKSNGKVIVVRCRSLNNWSEIRYKSTDIDWLAVYDQTTDKCYFIPSSLLGVLGRTQMNLRITPTGNKQIKLVLWAKDFLEW
jgi:PD-(D/E)XK endonuclease